MLVGTYMYIQKHFNYSKPNLSTPEFNFRTRLTFASCRPLGDPARGCTTLRLSIASPPEEVSRYAFYLAIQHKTMI